MWRCFVMCADQSLSKHCRRYANFEIITSLDLSQFPSPWLVLDLRMHSLHFLRSLLAYKDLSTHKLLIKMCRHLRIKIVCETNGNIPSMIWLDRLVTYSMNRPHSLKSKQCTHTHTHTCLCFRFSFSSFGYFYLIEHYRSHKMSESIRFPQDTAGYSTQQDAKHRTLLTLLRAYKPGSFIVFLKVRSFLFLQFYIHLQWGKCNDQTI